jgi:hypothetical protein
MPSDGSIFKHKAVTVLALARMAVSPVVDEKDLQTAWHFLFSGILRDHRSQETQRYVSRF